MNRYSVSVCKEGNPCSEGEEVVRDEYMQFIEFNSRPELAQCSDYTLHIKPLYAGTEMDAKVISFRTLSQPLGDVAANLMLDRAEPGAEQMVTLRWNALQCADHYQVFQKVNTPEGQWESIGTTDKNFYQQKGVPCTEYKYGVKVTVDDVESDIVELTNQ